VNFPLSSHSSYKEALFMGSKKLQVWLPVLFALVMIVGMMIGFKLREKTSQLFSLRGKDEVEEVLDLVQSRYVDNISSDSLKNSVIDEILSKLDPHSVYIPPEELNYANEDLEGNFKGIGVEFQQFNDTVNVINVLKDGPADKAGVKVGDMIIKVNDTVNLVKKDADQIRKALRGPGGSKVVVTVLRGNQQKKLEISRGTIPLPSLDAAYMIAPKTGFIHLNKFSETTYEEFMSSLEKLQKQGMEKLILDIRGNGGGLLNEAVQIADEFLDDDKLIVYTKGTHVTKQEYNAKREGLFEKGKLVLLIDETSASASEVLAGALQDWDRATIIGRRSFGKGLVQEQYQLSDGAALRLTVARYYSPLGRNIQKPYTGGRKKYYEDFYNRYNSGELVHGDTAVPVGKPFKTPGGRTVYGGGGITPDIFVGVDSGKLDKNIASLYTKNTLQNFIYRYYVSNINTFSKFKDPEGYYSQFSFGENEWKQLNSFAMKDSINLQNVPQKDKMETLERMKTMMARQIWRYEGFYEVNNQTDKAVKKALEVLK
jgi:carboxyl-terminal processing protease